MSKLPELRGQSALSCQALRVYHYISLHHPEVEAAPELSAVLDSLTELSDVLSRTGDPMGGLRRADLVASARPVLRRCGFTIAVAGAVQMPVTGSSDSVEVDAYHAGTRSALTIHGGRAWMNNEAVVAVLQMAAAQDVRAAVVLAPHRYKGTPAAGPIASFVERLAFWEGVQLDLDAVVVVGY